MLQNSIYLFYCSWSCVFFSTTFTCMSFSHRESKEIIRSARVIPILNGLNLCRICSKIFICTIYFLFLTYILPAFCVGCCCVSCASSIVNIVVVEYQIGIGCCSFVAFETNNNKVVAKKGGSSFAFTICTSNLTRLTTKVNSLIGTILNISAFCSDEVITRAACKS